MLCITVISTSNTIRTSAAEQSQIYVAFNQRSLFDTKRDAILTCDQLGLKAYISQINL